jgi:hypothetical protein
MSTAEPTAELDPRFSSEGAEPTAWAEARERLEVAETYWLSTVRADGRPHVTPIAAVMLDDSLYFATGGREQKAANLATNPRCVVTTGCDAMDGLDVVLEAEARRVSDVGRLQAIATAYPPKYLSTFPYTVQDDQLHIEGSDDEILAFELVPTKAFAFAKGNTFSQTRWRFDPE